MRRPTRQITMQEQQVIVRERAMYMGHALGMFENDNFYAVTKSTCMRCNKVAYADPQHRRSTSGMLGEPTEIRCHKK